MNDELDRLREEMQAVKPRDGARRRGIDAAMAAFDAEFDARPEAAGKRISPSAQGTAIPLRPTPRKAPDDRAADRRRKPMDRSWVSRNGWMLGGTGIAAAIALFVVVQQDDDPFSRAFREDGGSILAELSAIADDADGARESFADAARSEPEPLGELAAKPMTEPAPPPPAALAPAPKASAKRLSSEEVVARLRQQSAEGAGQARTRALKLEADAAPTARIAPAPSDVQPGFYQETGRDRFAAFTPNAVQRVADTPVSTFSIDVDTASYSFLRASLNRGQIPPADAIRVEELINYFPYDYAAPESADEPFRANVTVMPTPWNDGTRLMHIGIKGYVPPVSERPRSNIVLLIDTSGSMNAPNKLPLLINSFKLLLGTLDEDDTVSIVTYAGSAGLVLEPTPASERRKIERALTQLNAGGSTAGGAGLALAYDTARDSFIKDGVNRVILATDGDFNVGYASPDEMKRVIESERESGVFLSVLGFGMGNLNDALMQALAQNGNGTAAYIDTLSEARKVLADEAGSALVPIAKDVKIQVEFNPATISEYRLIGYETRALNREDFNNDAVDAGEINAGHTVTAIYEITPKGSPAQMIDDLRYAEAKDLATDAAEDEYAFVKIRHKLPDGDTSTLQTRPVTVADAVATFGAADREARFAAAVAGFGQLLQANPHLRGFGYGDVAEIAAEARGADRHGYRAEFLNLVRLAETLDKTR